MTAHGNQSRRQRGALLKAALAIFAKGPRTVDNLTDALGKEFGPNTSYKQARDLIARLKRDALVSESRQPRGSFLITGEGRAKTAVLLPPGEYESLPGERMIIITFDVPEKERRKRDWLRWALVERLELTMIQKSVAIGRRKLPKQFLADLEKLHILDYVEIFEITKTGSLRHVA